MLIQEVILENFMSYEYARVPLRPGINIVCGPNGAGKSSLLLAISVALGQSYTERSRKLSELIRWGKDQARITLILDNSKRSGRRPIPKVSKDQIFLTRILRRDGKYWFELDNVAVSKQEVDRLLAKLGVNPDNMLIIMHQNMVEQFTVLTPQEKLRMIEAAVGLEAYRENVLQAQKKLTRILSQEESINKLLESAEQTLKYWREQYDKLQEKRQLLAKRKFLEREMAWAEVSQRESTIKEAEAKLEKEMELVTKIEEEKRQTDNQLKMLLESLENAKRRLREELGALINLEREKAKNQAIITLCSQFINEAKILRENNLKMLKVENLSETINKAMEYLAVLDSNIQKSLLEINQLENRVDGYHAQILDSHVKSALLQYRIDNLKASIKGTIEEIEHLRVQLEAAIRRAEEKGPRVAVIKSPAEILEEIRVIDGFLSAFVGISDDVERMYESYSRLYLELKEKALEVAEHRKKAMEEIETRMYSWQTVIRKLLDSVNVEFQRIMSQLQAIGEVKLINEHDIEAAGIEILVGFKGGKPVPLNAYTQSGGERTTATMGLLLALQKHVRSPFRAVDEYDVHMDPKNRELIAQTLISVVKETGVQYLVITPSQIAITRDDVNVITVQNIEGKSIIKEVS
ncbi:MAG: AAA family ATPase [Candidatus Bathyarchaeia archaeon]